MPEEFLTYENIRATAPRMMDGDLHIVPEGVFHLAYQKVNPIAFALQTQLGLLGIWLMRRSAKKRAARMAEWRAGHGGQPLDELATSLPGSVVIPPEEMTQISHGLMAQGLRIKRRSGKPLVLSINKDQWKVIRTFAEEHGWPVK
jgi:hypothetical protein